MSNNQSLVQWMTEELVLEATRMVKVQERVVADAEAEEWRGGEFHLKAVEARRALRRLRDARARLRKDIQPRLF